MNDTTASVKTEPTIAPRARFTAHEVRAEVSRLRTVGKKLDAMGPGERGRTLRYFLDKYRDDIASAGFRGEP